MRITGAVDAAMETARVAAQAALYHERWEIETALDEVKTHLRGASIVLHSETRRSSDRSSTIS